MNRTGISFIVGTAKRLLLPGFRVFQGRDLILETLNLVFSIDIGL